MKSTMEILENTVFRSSLFACLLETSLVLGKLVKAVFTRADLRRNRRLMILPEESSLSNDEREELGMEAI